MEQTPACAKRVWQATTKPKNTKNIARCVYTLISHSFRTHTHPLAESYACLPSCVAKHNTTRDRVRRAGSQPDVSKLPLLHTAAAEDAAQFAPPVL